MGTTSVVIRLGRPSPREDLKWRRKSNGAPGRSPEGDELVASLCHRLFLVHPKVQLLAGVNMAPVENLSAESFFIYGFRLLADRTSGL